MKQEILLELLAEFTVPELCDGMEVFRTMVPDIKPMVGNAKMIGTAFTIDVPAGEGGFIADVLPQVKAGEVIVIAGKGSVRSSYWGDHRSICAGKLGAAGIVIDGAFRDIEGCEAVGIPIFARAVTPGTALKSGKGRTKIAVSCGGVTVSPGDIIVGDRNGICVFPVDEAVGIIARAKEKIRNQAFTLAEMERTGTIITKVIKRESNRNE